MSKIEKFLAESFIFMDKVFEPTTLKVKVGNTKKHAFTGRDLNLKMENGKLVFNVTTLIRSGLQRDKEIELKRTTELELSNNEIKVYTKGKNVHITNISYPGFDSDQIEKKITGELTEITTKKYNYYKTNKYYRIVLPIYRKFGLWGDFTGWQYSVDDKPTHETLVKLHISGKEYHFYCISSQDQTYIIIDSIHKQSLETFQKTANSILLGYAFLKGEYHGTEARILTYESPTFKDPKSLRTSNLGGGIYGGFPVHTTKPYSLIQVQNKMKFKKDSQGRIIGRDDSGLKKYMLEFPNQSFSQLCELICIKGGILRAVILFVSNNAATLEMKIPILFVALENVTKVLIDGDKAVPKLLDDEKIITQIKTVVKTSVKEISSIERNSKPAGLSPEDEKIYKATFSRIVRKFYDFNKGTNNKKLMEPFIKFGYKLTVEEENLIFKYRNIFLHGDDFMTMEESYELEFKELFHITMRLHRLISVLLLKASGYSGYILNNPKIYDFISEKKLKEPVFLKI